MRSPFLEHVIVQLLLHLLIKLVLHLPVYIICIFLYLPLHILVEPGIGFFEYLFLLPILFLLYLLIELFLHLSFCISCVYDACSLADDFFKVGLFRPCFSAY